MNDLTDVQLADLLGAPSEDAAMQQKAAALVAALRQRQAQAQEQQMLGGVAGILQNPGIAAMGKSFGAMGAQQYEDAQNQLQAIPKATEQRLQRALEKQRNDQQAAYQNQNLTLEGQRQAQQAKHEDADLALKREALAASKYAVITPGGQIFNTRSGELGDLGPPKPAAGGAKGGKELDTMLRGFREDVDPSSGRGAGLFGKDQALVTSADKVLALLDNGKGGKNYNLTVRQVPELVQSVASMLSSGNQAAQAQLEHLMPKSWGASTAERLEYLTGHPQDAKLGDFVRQYAETAEREKKLAQQRIRDVQIRRLPLHQGGFGAHQAEYLSAAKQYLPGLSDDELSAAFQGKYVAPAAGADPLAAKRARLKELESLLGAPVEAPK